MQPDDPTAPDQLSDYMTAYYTWLAKYDGYEPRRMKVGEVNLYRPDDFYGIY